MDLDQNSRKRKYNSPEPETPEIKRGKAAVAAPDTPQNRFLAEFINPKTQTQTQTQSQAGQSHQHSGASGVLFTPDRSAPKTSPQYGYSKEFNDVFQKQDWNGGSSNQVSLPQPSLCASFLSSCLRAFVPPCLPASPPLRSPPSTLRLPVPRHARNSAWQLRSGPASSYRPSSRCISDDNSKELNHNMAQSNTPHCSFHNPLNGATAPHDGLGFVNPLFQPTTHPLNHFPRATNLVPLVNLPGPSAGHQHPSPGRTHLIIPSTGTSWATAVLVQASSPSPVSRGVASHGEHLGQDDKMQQEIDRIVSENNITSHPPNNFNSYDGSFVSTADMDSAFSNKRSLNVESPAFTPATLPVPRATTISSQAANAAPFTPRAMTSGSVTPSTQPDSEPSTFNPATIREFTPSSQLLSQQYETTHNIAANGTASDTSTNYDPFSMSTLNSAMPFTHTQHNPYLEDSTTLTGNTSGYYQAPATFGAPQQPLQYHLYAPIGPHKEDLLAYQRLTHDFFLPNDLREELQKKSEATRQVMQNSQLPVLDQFHTLVPLDTNHNKSAAVFGFPSWVYKATSSKNGHIYVLRRLEGFRLSNERAIRSVKDWKRVDNAGVVSVVDAFTTRAFGDSSLIVVYNYHAMSKTLVETHFASTNRYGNRATNSAVPEQTLWSYIVQIASAIKSVHSASLAVRCMDPSKVLLTEKGRIRLNACSVLDVVQFDANRPLAELQQEDFILFGKLILAIATNNLSIMSPTAQLKGPLEHLIRSYSQEFRDTITYLLTPSGNPSVPKDINDFIHGISSHVVSALDSALHANDSITSTLSGELENGRLVRLLAKLGSINERPDYDSDVRWSEVGERYILKLFRDYVFHQVDGNGKPVVDLGHILTNLNKLDAGTNQMIKLVSRDEQDVFLVTYKEIKKQVDSAWGELVKGGTGGKRF